MFFIQKTHIEKEQREKAAFLKTILCQGYTYEKVCIILEQGMIYIQNSQSEK
jgi:hypothetical protein